KEITPTDLVDPENGVTVSITGVEAGDEIKDSLTGDVDTADGETFKYHISSELPPEDIELGKVDFSVTITRDGEERVYDGLSFTVVEDEADDPETPAADPKISVSDKEVTAEDLQNNGITVEGEGFTPGGEVDF